MNYRCIIFLSMLYALLIIFDPIMSHKPILTPLYPIPAGLILGALWLALCNLIAEIYDLKISIQLFWTAVVCNFLIALLCYGLIQLPSPAFWYQKYSYEQHSYDLLFGHLPYEICYWTVTIFLGWYVNILLLTKWKAITKGKYFWIRCLIAVTIGQTIYLVVVSALKGIMHLYSLNTVYSELFNLAWCDLVKTSMVILLIPPSYAFIWLIKYIEYYKKPEKTEALIKEL